MQRRVSSDEASSGDWTIDWLDAGTSYRVHVSPNDGVHLDEWFEGATSSEEASPVVAPATVDISLAAGGTLAGT